MVKVIKKPSGKNIMDNHHTEPGNRPTNYGGAHSPIPKAFLVGPNWFHPRKRVTQERHDSTMKKLVKKLVKSKKKHEKLSKKMAEQLKPYME